ncbi:hypothetical protein [Noviherbaspirillum aridicola]|uniref:DUF2116 family Zn-ribbon domain-containing protein n=1 Tax=Noviherbaspirillum aridicola TaxID=2849687 RepID=A0ABQ4Q0A9_9BURK|nr:hypothetical protein [Noviherbaspirillum aridicola]GIZ50518.1 hypothetical protein NCCP691_05320 [Noviherbaspirillum aridicola]
MTDEADIAGEMIELRMQAAIEACSRAPRLPPKGSCWFCDEPLPPLQKFCDRDCSQDYELEQAALTRAGRWRRGDDSEE